jgi:hypothetical protein
LRALVAGAHPYITERVAALVHTARSRDGRAYEGDEYSGNVELEETHAECT